MHGSRATYLKNLNARQLDFQRGCRTGNSKNLDARKLYFQSYFQMHSSKVKFEIHFLSMNNLIYKTCSPDGNVLSTK